MTNLRDRLRWQALRVQRYRLPAHLLRGLCALGAERVGKAFCALPGVEAVYLRHSHPRHDSFVAGASDLDLTLVLEEKSADEPEILRAIHHRTETLSRFHFYLEPGDLRVTTARELDPANERNRTPVELLYRPDDWILLAGRELRSRPCPAHPADLVTCHPEFGRWWHHMLQNHLYRPSDPERWRYLRPIVRDMAKQRMQFLAALGRGLPRPPGQLSPAEFAGAFDDDPPTADLLRRIIAGGFVLPAEETDAIRLSLIHRALQDAASTYRRLPRVAPRGESVPIDSRSVRDPDALASLQQWLDGASELRAVIRSAIAYPIPFGAKDSYQLDLVLDDAATTEQLGRAVAEVIRCLGHRGATIGTVRTTLSLVPEGALSHALSYRGLPPPFQKEHVQRYGRALLGEMPAALFEPVGAEDLRRAIGQFVPYHRFNLARRVEASNEGIHFGQVAAARLFLATGEVETELEALRVRHEAVFPDAPEPALWHALTRDPPNRDHPTHSAAARALDNEYHRSEALLQQKSQMEPTSS